MPSDYARKIKALLAKAQGTDNEYEALIYQTQAEKLMVKWGIDDAMLQDEADRAIVHEHLTLVLQPTKGWCAFMDSIARGLGTVRVLMSSFAMEAVVIYVVGHQRDIDRYKLLWESLAPQANASMEAYWADQMYRLSPLVAVTDYMRENTLVQFLISYGGAVCNRLREERETASQAVQGAELALIDRGDEVDDFVDTTMAPTENVMIYQPNLSAYAAGWTSGHYANIHGRSQVTDG